MSELREKFEEYLSKGGKEHFDIYANFETYQAGYAQAMKDAIEEWEKPWVLCNGETFEARMRRKMKLTNEQCLEGAKKHGAVGGNKLGSRNR